MTLEGFPLVGLVPPVASTAVKTSPIGLGFEKLDRAIVDPETAYDHLAALGVKWIRIQSGWARTERRRGVYDFAWLDRIVDNLRRRGLTPWVCLCYGNPLYSPAAAAVFGAVGVPPIHTDEEKDAWANYVAAVTAHYRDRVEWYEVWNEPDGKWCWKHGPNGTEYGEFMKATALAARRGDSAAKVIGGSCCRWDMAWLNAALATGAAEHLDAFSYHAYTPDEREQSTRLPALRGVLRRYRAEIPIIQGETGAQSRADGAGAFAHTAWTPAKQAKFMARHILTDLFDEVLFSSYFSCMDMAEALHGVTGERASYADYGYFGVLGADFDASGHATGTYTPKPSYRTLQTLAAIFREDFRRADLPILLRGEPGPRYLRATEKGYDLLRGGFRRPDGSAAFVYWKPTDIMTATFEGEVTLTEATLPEATRLVDLVDGTIHAVPAERIEDHGGGTRTFHHLPVRDFPLALVFGDFIPRST